MLSETPCLLLFINLPAAVDAFTSGIYRTHFETNPGCLQLFSVNTFSPNFLMKNIFEKIKNDFTLAIITIN